MDDCLFCKLIGGQIPCEFLYQDEKTVIFRDIHPKAKTHLLIVPRKHIPSIAEMEEGDEEIVGHLVKTAKKIGSDFNLPGYQLQINVGKDGGQEIFHLHMHLMSKSG